MLERRELHLIRLIVELHVAVDQIHSYLHGDSSLLNYFFDFFVQLTTETTINFRSKKERNLFFLILLLLVFYN